MRIPHLLVLLAALTLLVLLLWQAVHTPEASLPAPEEAPEEGAANALDVDPEAAAGPALRGHTPPVAEAPQHASIDVQVLDRAGRPLPDLRVRYRLDGEDPKETRDARSALTDAQGWAVLAPDAPIERIELRAILPWHGAADPTGWQRPESTRHVIRLRNARPVDLHYVAADSGRPVEGVTLDPAHGRVYPKTLKAQGAGHYEAVLHLPDGQINGQSLTIHPPEGFIAWRPDDLGEAGQLSGAVGAYTERLHATVPLYRPLDLVVEVVDHEGRAVDDAIVQAVRLGRRRIAQPRDVPREAGGSIRVVGVPHFRNEPLTLEVYREDPELEIATTVSLSLRMPVDWREAVRLQARLPVPEPIEWEGPTNNGAIGLGGGRGSAFGDYNRPPPRLGHLLVRVLRRDGSPAVGASVRAGRKSGRTDATGHCRLEKLRPGETTLAVRQWGLLPIADRKVVIEADKTLEITLREPAGATLELEVVDEAGRPLPFARITVHKHYRSAWLGEVDGAQDIGRYTDVHGRKLLPQWAAGAGAIEVRWGTRKTVWSFDAADGKALHQRVVLPAAP